jgi:hypothetical protein
VTVKGVEYARTSADELRLGAKQKGCVFPPGCASGASRLHGDAGRRPGPLQRYSTRGECRVDREHFDGDGGVDGLGRRRGGEGAGGQAEEGRVQ